ncbi:hypothetical protein RLEG3_21710 [Rhizobium leguminosarum bv. trifolii WSM1689]|nr:hypothetical protein RLEG3_21710 [Rhizobium leguminosarum bv. trifolii WSM1689]
MDFRGAVRGRDIFIPGLHIDTLKAKSGNFQVIFGYRRLNRRITAQ